MSRERIAILHYRTHCYITPLQHSITHGLAVHIRLSLHHDAIVSSRLISLRDHHQSDRFLSSMSDFSRYTFASPIFATDFPRFSSLISTSYIAISRSQPDRQVKGRVKSATRSSPLFLLPGYRFLVLAIPNAKLSPALHDSCIRVSRNFAPIIYQYTPLCACPLTPEFLHSAFT